MIHLIGPGGAGKTTIGARLAKRLSIPFVDVDAEFTTSRGDISSYIDTHGYDTYASQNVSLYAALIAGVTPRVLALSSGFMTYPHHMHPDYRSLRERIAASRLTFVLLPALDIETCVAETVRRQLTRAFARSPEREEQVIRARFQIHASLPVRKVETMRPIEAIVADLIDSIA